MAASAEATRRAAAAELATDAAQARAAAAEAALAVATAGAGVEAGVGFNAGAAATGSTAMVATMDGAAALLAQWVRGVGSDASSRCLRRESLRELCRVLGVDGDTETAAARAGAAPCVGSDEDENGGGGEDGGEDGAQAEPTEPTDLASAFAAFLTTGDR